MVSTPSAGGRPRRSGVVTDDPRTGIVTAAAALFARQGFHATRMSQIAGAAGLRQSSIYYWFRSKDEILRSIMDQNRWSLTAARALLAESEAAAVRLYVVLYLDVVQMCSAPLNFYSLEEAAVDQPDVFEDFHVAYAELTQALAEIVAAGVEGGDLQPVEPAEFVSTALSLNEGVQYRFHASGGEAEDVGRVADSAATMAVRSLLPPGVDVAGVRRLAREGVGGFRAVVPA
ncbi:TetR/AcrR family transcriptional regulator [Litorihabitans aurantiacus]|uniref:HTH tetR-type domain-containing protein n=1 Tax=Litorihabitans aurantiacus TaxID=1930061 RepID=A0AA37XGJ1_9MICO|nr:TetR/AcrR family transcriptional regulator [Litorihabitans aurantiacus]GMA32822.1 hypothetical protein GCM10025875_28140 [Litorihabitans aurantiacus]